MKQINTREHSRIIFWGLLGLLLGLCFVRYALQVNIPLAALLMVSVLIALLGDQDEVIALCICMIPLDTSVQYNYVLIACILLYLVKFGKSVRINLTIVPVLLMVIWELLHCIGAPFSIPEFLNDCLPLLLMVIVMCAGKKRFDYDFIVRAFAASVAAMCLCLLGRVLYTTNFNLLLAMGRLRRLGLDAESAGKLAIVGGQQNPNTLGIQCVLAITGLLQLRTTQRKGQYDMVLILFLLMFGALTSSRTYLACVAIMTVLFVLGQKGSLTDKLKFFGGILLVLLLAFLVLYAAFPDLLEYYYNRFLVNDISTGRVSLMEIYHRYIVSDNKVLFFGIGLHNFFNKVLVQYRIALHVPHNGIQELILAWGIPGVLLMIMLWAAMILRSRDYVRKQYLLHYIPFLIILAKVQVGQMLDSPYTMLAFSYAYLSLCADITPGSDILKRKRR